jgi:hypothetical protein
LPYSSISWERSTDQPPAGVAPDVELGLVVVVVVVAAAVEVVLVLLLKMTIETLSV